MSSVSTASRRTRRKLLALPLLACGGFWQTTSAPAAELAQRQPVSAATIYLKSPNFRIPFTIQAGARRPEKVQLWVSNDSGQHWQLHGNEDPGSGSFEFRAAAQGHYWFSVKTVNSTGDVIPSNSPPMQVCVDTTKPRAEIIADIDSDGSLKVAVRVQEQHLQDQSARLEFRTDTTEEWSEVQLSELEPIGDLYEAAGNIDVDHCREVVFALTVEDLSGNIGEAVYTYTMPRTAQAPGEMTLASNRPTSSSSTGAAHSDSNWSRNPAPTSVATIESLPGATAWEPSPPKQPIVSAPATARPQAPRGSVALEALRPDTVGKSPARMAAARASGLELEPSLGEPEELPPPRAFTSDQAPVASQYDAPNQPLPPALGAAAQPAPAAQSILEQQALAPAVPETDNPPLELGAQSTPPESPTGPNRSTEPEGTTAGNAYHCNARTFSLDYSVEALGGRTLADIELWGTEDGGRTWVKWGTDPDRQSPFDVKVGNDGLFGFRMVIIGNNGTISNRPTDGDNADVWINVDTELPAARITRAVYGEGPEDGMLVIDYTCNDHNLVSRPITLSYSASADGPWRTIATGLTNSELYLWKAPLDLPKSIYLRIEAADKAGNIGEYRLDLPIASKGLAPHGQIRGVRPIRQ